jgi:hypothetical protein
MALHLSPEQHAANPPESWRVEREQDGGRVWWHLHIDTEGDRAIQAYRTRKEATENLTSGFYFNLYAKEGRWFAGGKIDGWKSYAETLRDRAEATARRIERERGEARKVERMGTTADALKRWNDALASGKAGAVEDAAGEMLDLLNAGNLIDQDSLERAEAVELYCDLGSTWGLCSPVTDRLERLRYSGLDDGKTALQVVEEMEQAEHEMLRLVLPTTPR